jgi:hypothetical protein
MFSDRLGYLFGDLDVAFIGAIHRLDDVRRNLYVVLDRHGISLYVGEYAVHPRLGRRQHERPGRGLVPRRIFDFSVFPDLLGDDFLDDHVAVLVAVKRNDDVVRNLFAVLALDISLFVHGISLQVGESRGAAAAGTSLESG